MHLHLDPVGGIAGDMFVAALLDLWPAQADPLARALAGLALPEGVSAGPAPFSDGTLTGTRYLVAAERRDSHHRRFREIRALIADSALPPAIRRRAVAIFTLLAEVEGRVHGVPVDDVAFHEIGAWDSIVDIVAAAFLVEAAGAASWSVAPLPLGSGRVRTAHGEMPVPPPAVALLIEGFPVIDDGRAGERVTPTGAAILRHLAPGPGLPRAVLRHGGVGYGFGTKRFPGISNVLRVTAFERSAAIGAVETIGILRFEVDDQTPEDLAVGLERLRAMPGVIDVLQGAALGKKGRMVAQIQVLTQDFALEAVAETCLAETTTLGVRLERVSRRTLPRESTTVTDADGRSVRVKTARRPDGAHTTKAEMDDIAAASGDHADRANRRARIERAAPGGDGSDG
jgi:pyridinium-3,5-bisthiocarboxylic acid mononucleotide nickel chelatase